MSISQNDKGDILLHCHAGCSTEAVCSALKIKPKDLFHKNGSSLGEIVAEYPYCDANGKLLFHVIRYRPKTFRQRAADGTWSTKDIPKVLYRLPELLASDPSLYVHVCEGEKDADFLRSSGLIATCNPGGAGKFTQCDFKPLYGRHVCIVADTDNPGLAHAQDVFNALSGHVQSIKFWDCRPHKDIYEWSQNEPKAPPYVADWPFGAISPPAPDRSPERRGRPKIDHSPIVPDGRPILKLSKNEHEVVDAAIRHLSGSDAVFQRGTTLVKICRSFRIRSGVTVPDGTPMIAQSTPQDIRTEIARRCMVTKETADGEEVHAHPPTWLYTAVHSVGRYPTIKPLRAVCDFPVLRPDGSIFSQNGYDPLTGVFCELSHQYHPLDLPDAIKALNDVVCDFPFSTDAHKAAWLASLLTPIARFAFDGPAPLFLIDANERGVGKTLLARITGLAVLGRSMPVIGFSKDAEELRKLITSIAIAALPVALFDNLTGPFGSPVIDRLLTSDTWSDRMLGRNEAPEIPLLTTWYATGNNIQITGDLARRCCHIRLDFLGESPEQRGGFRHENLHEHITGNRATIVNAALTVLSYHLKQGVPITPPMGGFEGWSNLVRSAVETVYQADPISPTDSLIVDDEKLSFDALINAIKSIFPTGIGFSAKQLLEKCADNEQLAESVTNFRSGKDGELPSPMALGKSLNSIVKRVHNNTYIHSYRDETGRRYQVKMLGY